MRKFFEVTLIPVVTGGVFTLIFAIYGLPAIAIGYAWMLSLFIGGVIAGLFGMRYLLVLRRLKTIEQAEDKTIFSKADVWTPTDELEKSYQTLIFDLIQELQVQQNRHEGRTKELQDHYGLWVHQIKTPIAALDLMLQTELDSSKSRAMKLELFKIEQYVELALHILRLNAESTDLVLKAVDLETVVNQSVKKYKSLFIEKKISLELTVEPLEILSDEKWLSILLEQLISNALKYTPSGSIRIYTDPKAVNSLVIEDTGIGIRPEDLPRIFDKGFTGFNGRIDQHATGIGLYVTKQACDKLGIGIDIQSAVEKGTQVRLSLIPYTHVSLEMKM